MSELQPRRAESLVDTDNGAAAERRNRPRLTPLVQPAKLISGDCEYLCIVRDASEDGMKLNHFGHLPGASGLMVELTNGERFSVTVIWNDGTHAGVRFDSRVDIARIVSLALGDYPRRPLRLDTNFAAQLGWLDEHVHARVRLSCGRKGQWACSDRGARVYHGPGPCAQLLRHLARVHLFKPAAGKPCADAAGVPPSVRSRLIARAGRDELALCSPSLAHAGREQFRAAKRQHLGSRV